MPIFSQRLRRLVHERETERLFKRADKSLSESLAICLVGAILPSGGGLRYFHYLSKSLFLILTSPPPCTD